MGVRQWIQTNPAGGIVAAVALIGFAVFWLLRSDLGASVASDQSRRSVWFYDLDTGALFASTGPAMAPITAPSGGQGVYAHVYSCGQCGHETEQYILYLSTHPDGNPAGRLVTTYDASNPPSNTNPPKWADDQTDAGIAITEMASKMAEQCPDRFELCYP